MFSSTLKPGFYTKVYSENQLLSLKWPDYRKEALKT
jgi:hypothetical protein